MPIRSLSAVVQQLRAAAERDGTGPTDGELLTRFLSRRDGDALAALVERHAPMVWGVCRRVLRNPQDAEDAFQATFLVLVQKAATVAPREMVANWLYGVAQQTAVRLRATASKRGGREVQMEALPEPAVVGARDEELLSRLDEELSRLPARFRALIVLCDLEGHTRKVVARQLGCPEGTVASGLVRARELLAKRLIRRGLVVPGGTLAATLSHSLASAEVPALVVTSTINVATLLAPGKAAGAISGPVATLTQGVLKTMFLKKIMTAAVALLALGVAAVAGGSLAVGPTEGEPAVGRDEKPPGAEKAEAPAAQPEQEAFTAWGKEAGGLQAGLGFRPRERRAYHHGESVTLVVRVRNVSKQAVTFQYLVKYFTEHPPTVTDAEGHAVPVEAVTTFGRHIPEEVKLGPGKETSLRELTVELRQPKKGARNFFNVFHGTGKFRLSYDPVLGNTSSGRIELDPALEKLATGKLELEVKADPPRPVVNKPPHVVEKLDMKGRMEPGLPWKVGAEPTEETIRVATKTFVSMMGSYPDYRFREFFDPRYLKKHGLADKEIAFEVVGGYRGLQNYEVADDNRTILCTLLRTVDGKEVREVFLLRWVFHDGCLYVSPENAPDPKTGIFKPWILRTVP